METICYETRVTGIDDGPMYRGPDLGHAIYSGCEYLDRLNKREVVITQYNTVGNMTHSKTLYRMTNVISDETGILNIIMECL
jgi:hypothetical protein